MSNTTTGRVFLPREYIEYLIDGTQEYGHTKSCPHSYKCFDKMLSPAFVRMCEDLDDIQTPKACYLSSTPIPCLELEVEMDVNFFNERGELIKDIPASDLMACSASGDNLPLCQECVTELGFVAPPDLAIPYLLEYGFLTKDELKAMDLYELSIKVFWVFAGNYRDSGERPLGLIH